MQHFLASMVLSGQIDTVPSSMLKLFAYNVSALPGPVHRIATGLEIRQEYPLQITQTANL